MVRHRLARFSRGWSRGPYQFGIGAGCAPVSGTTVEHLAHLRRAVADSRSKGAMSPSIPFESTGPLVERHWPSVRCIQGRAVSGQGDVSRSANINRLCAKKLIAAWRRRSLINHRSISGRRSRFTSASRPCLRWRKKFRHSPHAVADKLSECNSFWTGYPSSMFELMHVPMRPRAVLAPVDTEID